MPAEEATKVETQAEADAKMVDIPDTGPAVDVDITDTKKVVNPDEEDAPVEETASSDEMDDY